MRGLKSEDVSAIVDFLYFGEADVLQENLESRDALRVHKITLHE